MKNIYPIIISSIAAFSTIIGNILLFINKKHKNKVLSFSLGLSFAVMFLISILELIPSGINLASKNYSNITIFILSLILLLIGYTIVYIIDKKIENKDNLYKVGILSMISLLIHNIPEGIICAITTSTNLKLGLKISMLILIHNIPEGICISLPIYYTTKSKLKSFLYTTISGLGEVLGAIIAIILLKNYINDFILYIILIITAGIMITLSTIKIFKEGLSYKNHCYFILGIILGTTIIIITL